uniref:Uncharacterized protein n=1 Tax=uncultured gamma proteobacterium HF0010_01E20 TaxID=710977 RepID=E0XQ79_9GAMM|nr:hypothetical protein [uncultured gamma proteobacterium HF0010_01E20]
MHPAIRHSNEALIIALYSISCVYDHGAGSGNRTRIFSLEG